MENFNQTPNMAPNSQVPPTQGYQPVQVIPPVQIPPMMLIDENKTPGLLSFCCHIISFFVPIVGLLLGCVFNLTNFSNKEKVSKSILTTASVSILLWVILFALYFLIILFLIMIGEL